MELGNQDILFTQQKHEAYRAGLHYDYRVVIGDKAYSWASKKEMPLPGQAIIFHEQPVHTSSYALSKKVVIPKGQYGGGVTNLMYVKKGVVNTGKDYYTLNLGDGQKFLLKHIPSYGEKSWLLKNISPLEKYANVYLGVICQLV